MGRVTRPSAQRGRLLWTAAAIGVALVVALMMLVADLADSDEVAATLLLAPVFVVALWTGRNAALAVAAAAAAAYAGLRMGDVEDVGAAGVVVLVAARGAVFVAVAWFTPVVAPLLPGMGGRRRPQHRMAGAGLAPPGHQGPPPAPSPASALADLGGHRSSGHFAGGQELAPVPGFGAGEEPSMDAWDTSDPWDGDGDDDAWDGESDVPAAPRWEEPLTPPDQAWGDALAPQGGPPVDDGGIGYTVYSRDGDDRDDGYDRDGAADDDSDELAASAWGLPAGQPQPTEIRPNGDGWGHHEPDVPPQLPTGWLDDAGDAHDQTIPVGYTGELFLPPDLSMAGSPTTVDPHPDGNGWSGPQDRPAHPSYPDYDTAAGGGSTAGRVPVPDVPVVLPPPPPPPSASPAPATTTNELVGPDAAGHTPTQDPETRLWNARFFRERLTVEVDAARQAGGTFSVVLVQVPDEPFRALPYRRQVALLRELGHQFVAARVVDHLVHLPDGDRHWFAVILGDTDRPQAQEFERRLRTAIGGYLRHRGLQVPDIESASMTSPDDDQLMADVWASLLGTPPSPDPTPY